MKKQSHTPRERWFFTDFRQDPRTDGVAINCVDAITIFERETLEVVAKISPANVERARIATLAPEMLEALEACRVIIALTKQRWPRWIEDHQLAALEQLIARAKGES